MGKPRVTVMCGSSRFVEEMAAVAWIIERDEMSITMGLHLLPWWYLGPTDHLAEAALNIENMDTRGRYLEGLHSAMIVVEQARQMALRSYIATTDKED